MAGDDRKRRSGTAMGERNTGVGRYGDCGTHAGNDLERYTCVRQSNRLFAAAPEDKWIAALQANDFVACMRALDQYTVDVSLRGAMMTRLFADVDFCCRIGSFCQYRGIHELIIDDHV